MVSLVPRARTRGRSRSSGPRRSSSGGTEWVLTSHLFTVTPAVPNVGLLLVPNEIVNFMTSPTYLGGHIEVMAQASYVDPPPSQGFISLGIRAVPLRTWDIYNSAGSGPVEPSELPLPWSDGEGSWAYHRQFYLSTGGAAGNPAFPEFRDVHSITNTVRFHDLARSARRLNTDEVLVMLVELSGTPINPPTGSVCGAVSARLLLKEK